MQQGSRSSPVRVRAFEDGRHADFALKVFQYLQRVGRESASDGVVEVLVHVKPRGCDIRDHQNRKRD